MRTIIVGKEILPHIEGIQVILQENIQFPAKSQEVSSELWRLVGRARNLGAEAILFQDCTASLVIAASHVAQLSPIQIGFIISLPGPKVSKSFDFTSYEFGAAYSWVARDAVEFASHKARVDLDGDNMTVTIDGPPQFSHIEWLGI